VTLDAMPIGLADPEPIPVAPWMDEQTRLEARLATVEQDLERLRQRHAVVAADLDTLVAGEPWAQAEAVRVADPRRWRRWRPRPSACSRLRAV
jgi:hypothetical protein